MGKCLYQSMMVFNKRIAFIPNITCKYGADLAFNLGILGFIEKYLL
jgi:hypothetical protein